MKKLFGQGLIVKKQTIKNPPQGTAAKPADPVLPSAKTAPIVVKPEVLLDTACAGMEELCALLQSEMDCLKQRDVQGVRDLLKRKHQLIQDYQANLKALAALGAGAKTIDEDKRKKARALGEKLQAMGQKNARMLDTAIIGTRSIIETVIQTIKDEALPVAGYNHLSDRRHQAAQADSCPSVMINRTA